METTSRFRTWSLLALALFSVVGLAVWAVAGGMPRAASAAPVELVPTAVTLTDLSRVVGDGANVSANNCRTSYFNKLIGPHEVDNVELRKIEIITAVMSCNQVQLPLSANLPPMLQVEAVEVISIKCAAPANLLGSPDFLTAGTGWVCDAARVGQ